jgi:hypothetical protein
MKTIKQNNETLKICCVHTIGVTYYSITLPLLRVDDGAHLHPEATKHKEKRKKKRELSRLGNGAHPLPKATKQKEKRSWPLLKVGDGAHQNQNQNKKEKKKKIGCLPLTLCFQTFHSSSFKL